MKTLFFILLLVSIAINCQATSKYQSLSEIRHQVDLFVHNEIPVDTGDHLSIEVSQMDDRLQLKKCPKDKMTVFNPYPSTVAQTNTLGVKCQSDSIRWTLYVSVNTKIEKTILVAKRNLRRGHIIDADDLVPGRRDIVPLKQGWFTNQSKVIGMICRQNIDMNQPITPYLLKKETLVHRGDMVTISADSPSIHITMNGKALATGSQGDVIRVENLKSKRVIQAEIIGQRQVQVTI